MQQAADHGWPQWLVSPQPDLHAELYTALHQGNPGDVAFYTRACAQAERVVEFGAGSGRVSLALAQADLSVVGVEYDQALLALAQRRQSKREQQLGYALPARFQLGDMSCFRSTTQFDRVLIPYSGFWCLQGPEKKRECLEAAYRCLQDDGVLYLDAYDADGLGDGEDECDGEGPVVDDFELAHELEHDGMQLSVFERNVWWPEQRRIRVDYQLIPHATHEMGWRMSVAHHYLPRHELAELLENCGFEVEWGPDVAAEDSAFAEQLIVAAVKT